MKHDIKGFISVFKVNALSGWGKTWLRILFCKIWKIPSLEINCKNATTKEQVHEKFYMEDNHYGFWSVLKKIKAPDCLITSLSSQIIFSILYKFWHWTDSHLLLAGNTLLKQDDYWYIVKIVLFTLLVLPLSYPDKNSVMCSLTFLCF